MKAYSIGRKDCQYIMAKDEYKSRKKALDGQIYIDDLEAGNGN